MGLIGSVFVVVAALLQCVAATDHVVGGSTGWTIPQSAQVYSNWAAGQTYAVGDTLTFNFQTGAHDVTKVSKSAYESCTKSNPLSAPISTGPAKVTLDTAGEHYFICTVGSHCSAGQKLAVNVGSSSSTPTPSTTPSTVPSGPSPSPTSGEAPNNSNSAASVAAGFGVAGISMAVLSAFFL